MNELMRKSSLNFILTTMDASEEAIRNSLVEFGEGLEILALKKAEDSRVQDYNIIIRTEDPTIIFDLCAEFGRIKSVKIS